MMKNLFNCFGSKKQKKATRIGIVGVSSSGKSMLLNNLLRCFNLFYGEEEWLSGPSNDDDPDVTKAYAYRHDKKLYRRKYGKNIYEFVDIPGEAFLAGASSDVDNYKIAKKLILAGRIPTVCVQRWTTNREGNNDKVVRIITSQIGQEDIEGLKMVDPDEVQPEEVAALRYHIDENYGKTHNYKNYDSRIEDVYQYYWARGYKFEEVENNKQQFRPVFEKLDEYDINSVLIVLEKWRKDNVYEAWTVNQENVNDVFYKNLFPLWFCDHANDVIVCHSMATSKSFFLKKDQTASVQQADSTLLLTGTEKEEETSVHLPEGQDLPQMKTNQISKLWDLLNKNEDNIERQIYHVYTGLDAIISNQGSRGNALTSILGYKEQTPNLYPVLHLLLLIRLGFVDSDKMKKLKEELDTRGDSIAQLFRCESKDDLPKAVIALIKAHKYEELLERLNDIFYDLDAYETETFTTGIQSFHVDGSNKSLKEMIYEQERGFVRENGFCMVHGVGIKAHTYFTAYPIWNDLSISINNPYYMPGNGQPKWNPNFDDTSDFARATIGVKDIMLDILSRRDKSRLEGHATRFHKEFLFNCK